MGPLPSANSKNSGLTGGRCHTLQRLCAILPAVRWPHGAHVLRCGGAAAPIPCKNAVKTRSSMLVFRFLPEGITGPLTFLDVAQCNMPLYKFWLVSCLQHLYFAMRMHC